MAKKTADDWALAALAALARGGESAVRVEALARDLQVTKGSFYHHFKNRRQILERAVEMWERFATEQVIEAVDDAAGAPAERLVLLVQRVFPEDERNDAIEAALREWSATDPSIAARLAKVDERRLGYVESLLRQAGLDHARERSEILYRALVGEFTYRRAGGAALSPTAIALFASLLLTPAKPMASED